MIRSEYPLCRPGKGLARAYYDGLKNAYSRCAGRERRNRFASAARGAAGNDAGKWLRGPLERLGDKDILPVLPFFYGTGVCPERGGDVY